MTCEWIRFSSIIPLAHERHRSIDSPSQRSRVVITDKFDSESYHVTSINRSATNRTNPRKTLLFRNPDVGWFWKRRWPPLGWLPFGNLWDNILHLSQHYLLFSLHLGHLDLGQYVWDKTRIPDQQQFGNWWQGPEAKLSLSLLVSTSLSAYLAYLALIKVVTYAETCC